MAKIGRPPMTEARIRERISVYCARYGVTEINDAGFPAFPAGLRETEQHREWISLFKLFSRFRERSGLDAGAGPGGINCPVCLERLPGTGRPHRRCADVVAFVRELGEPGLDRVRLAAFPPRARGPARP